MARSNTPVTDNSEAAQNDAEQRDQLPETPAPDAAATEAPKGLGLDFITSGGFTLEDADMAAAAAPVRARSDEQQAMDEVVRKMNAHWKSANGPTTWPNLVAAKCVTTYFVEPDKTASIKKLIDRAASLLGIRIRYGTSFLADEKLVAKFSLPAEYLGREVISFAAPDKRQQGSKSE